MSSSEHCLFCDEQQKAKNIIFENDLFYARWDQIPLTLGHAEVVPKRHVQYFEQLTDDELGELMVCVRQLVSIVRESRMEQVYEGLLEGADEYVLPFLTQALAQSRTVTVAPDAFNHGINDGPAAGQTVPHLHYHVIPRWQGDVVNPRGGIRNMFPDDAYSHGGDTA